MLQRTAGRLPEHLEALNILNFSDRLPMFTRVGESLTTSSTSFLVKSQSLSAADWLSLDITGGAFLMKSIQRSLKNTRAEAAFVKMANCILFILTVVFFRLKGLPDNP